MIEPCGIQRDCETATVLTLRYCRIGENCLLNASRHNSNSNQLQLFHYQSYIFRKIFHLKYKECLIFPPFYLIHGNNNIEYRMDGNKLMMFQRVIKLELWTSYQFLAFKITFQMLLHRTSISYDHLVGRKWSVIFCW